MIRWYVLSLALIGVSFGCATVDVKGCGGLPDGASCDDSNPCTENDVCLADLCQGTLVDCSEFDAECASGACDPASGQCISQSFLDGSFCSSGDTCLEAEICEAGVCGGGRPRACIAANDCEEGFCDLDSGDCASRPKTNGEACDDGNACTGPADSDSCIDGNCEPGPPVSCALPSELDSECAIADCDPADNDGDPCIITIINEGDPCNDNDNTTSNTVCSQGFCGNGVAACTPQGPEPNENASQAIELSTGAFAEANICQGDLDFFAFDLVLPGESLALEVHDAIGGCSFDSVLELRRNDGSANGQLITSNDNAGEANCPAIDPNQDLNASNLSSGTFFGVVRGKTGNEQGSYILEVDAGPDLETEPNDTLVSADRHQLSSGPYRGRISSSSDVDLVRFQVNSPTRLFAFINDGNSQNLDCPFDSKLEILDANGQVVSGISVSDGFGNCPLIDLTFQPPAGFSDLGPGEFFFRISGENNQTGTYQLTALFESIEHESNNSVASSEGVFDAGAVEGNLGASDLDFYRFALTAPGSIAALTTGSVGGNCAVDTVIELRDADGTTILASADDIDVDQNRCSFLDPDLFAGARDLEPGVYFLVLRGFSGADVGDYRLEFAILRENEAEPNATKTTADPLSIIPGLDQASISGRLSPFAVDVYAITVPQGADLTIETSDGAGSCITDTIIDLRDTNGLSTSTLASDDDDGLDIPNRNFGCSRISPAQNAGASNLPAGTYFIVVRPFAVTGASNEGPYVLSVSID